jgi:hypothetical protein
MRRILIVYQSKPTIVSGLKKGFESQGIEVLTFLADDYQLWIDRYVFRVINKLAHNLRILKKESFLFTKHKLSHWNYLNTKLVDFCNQNKPDGVFFIHGIHYSDETMSQITCSKLGWLVDPVLNPARLQTFTSKMDWYFSYSQKAIKIVNQFGFSNTSFLPHAVDHRQFYIIPNQPKFIDLCFVGKHSVHREKYILAALELTRCVHVYGSRWRTPALSKPALLRSIKGTECFGEKLNTIYNSTKIVLSIIAKPQGSNNLQSGINMRPYEILASGSLLFSDNYDVLHPELINNHNLVLFNNVDEFKRSNCILTVLGSNQSEPVSINLITLTPVGLYVFPP